MLGKKRPIWAKRPYLGKNHENVGKSSANVFYRIGGINFNL